MNGPWPSLVVAFAVLGLTCSAQQAPVTYETAQSPGITRRQADEILEELRAIRKLLERQSAPAMPRQTLAIPQSGKLRVEGGYSFGSNNAPVTVVEFTDYECLYCRQFHDTTFAQLRKEYVDTGKIRIVIRDLPLVVHPNAMRAAEAARCAGDQGRFAAMHDFLFADPGKLGESWLIQYAESLKLDVAMFGSCLRSEKHKAGIQNDVQAAASLQISGTPSFLIGKSAGEEVSGAIIIGAHPFSVFEAKIKEAEAAH